MMDKGVIFERNLLSLSQRDAGLGARLGKAITASSRYKFIESRSGELIPAWVESMGSAHGFAHGSAHPLHSTMDPRREAKRLIDTVENEGFLVLLGLGGGYYAEAALERDSFGMVLVVEYDINGLAELLCCRDYTALFGDPRFRLLADPTEEELTQCILNLYQPALYGGIRVLPLRARTGPDARSFNPAGNAISAAIERVSADYSVQAHFGKRWFSNIIRNLRPAGEFQCALPSIRRAAISAAGPSLSLHIKKLRERRGDLFLIAADTSLPCLLNADIVPDAVISIDCQHISYYHFMDGLPEGVPLFLDLASPPLLASRFKNHLFFTSAHPLTRYISQRYRSLAELDSSGGNVSYAALSLAEQLGAEEIELYGADFSYPLGISYARGTYIYQFFGKKQNRFSPLEAQASSFLFRLPLEKKIQSSNSWYYETGTMKFYRERLEEKSASMDAVVCAVPGMGAPIGIIQGKNRKTSTKKFSSGNTLMSPVEFLAGYRNDIAELPMPGKSTADYLPLLNDQARIVFTTMLPVLAALTLRRGGGNFRQLLEEAQSYCHKEIDSVINSPGLDAK